MYYYVHGLGNFVCAFLNKIKIKIANIIFHKIKKIQQKFYTKFNRILKFRVIINSKQRLTEKLLGLFRKVSANLWMSLVRILLHKEYFIDYMVFLNSKLGWPEHLWKREVALFLMQNLFSTFLFVADPLLSSFSEKFGISKLSEKISVFR